MESTVLDQAQEYKNTIDKVNSLLLSLKSELIAMRKQDVKLLKQLIGVHDVIQTFCQKCVEYGTSHDVNFNSTPTDLKHRLPLIRQQSVPFYCGALLRNDTLNSSMGSSFEGIEEEDDFMSEDSGSICSLSGSFNSTSCYSHMINIRPIARSVSYDVAGNEYDTADDGKFEDILKRNIELWKFSNKEILSIPNMQYSDTATTFAVNNVQ